LIHPNTPEKWTASMQDSLARMLAKPEIKQGLAKKRAVASTVKPSGALGWYDPEKSAWRTSQQSLLTGLEQSLETWPRSGMTANGYVYELPIVGRLITVIDGGLLPTPTVSSGAQVAWKPTKGQTGGTTLEGWARWFPTPTARMWRGGGKAMIRKDGKERSDMLDWLVEAQEPHGRLNPDWVEWLMGWPVGWTALKPSETVKFLFKPPSHGDCSEASK
jgi:hypothetical protein